ncbi:hypothetical protein GIB67_041567 [Kingdonia uniflora]|uniref:Uncharacterized protein n=1 Tax=Kingdonia uniflora TaxID=39325 RepID=A0A7J7MQE0_9MAGN|nr:hypothetical protein GIB67_041567 [Kingdonia uniflora]
MFAALPEEEKGILRATCFAPLLLIDPIAAMPMLVVEIFDHHLAPAIGDAPALGAPAFDAPAIGNSSSATEIRAVVVRQVTPGEGLEVVKDLMVDDDVEVNLVAISFEYGGGLLKTMLVAEVVKTDIVFFNQEEAVGEAYQASADQITAVSVEEQTLEVEKIDDEASQTSANQTTTVSAEEQTIEVAQTDVVISHQEEDVGKASQEVEQNKEEVVEGKDDDDNGNLQNKLNPEQVIDMYIKAPIKYFDTQHRARPDKERIVLADIFACQYIGRAFNVWIRNMFSPESVELKKKSIWEQITSMQLDRTVSNCIH